VLGPNFKVLYKGGNAFKGQYYVNTAGKPSLNFVALKNGLKKVGNQGLLGGLKIPAAAQRVVALVKAAQLSNALNGLKYLPEKGEVGDFRKELTKRIEALQVQKKKIFDDLEKAGKKWQAFKAGSSYLRVFPQAKDASAVRTKVSKLQYDKDVKKELAAKGALGRVLAMAYGPRSNTNTRRGAWALFKQIVDTYKGTEAAKTAAKFATKK
jgi:hypothetical protein